MDLGCGDGSWSVAAACLTGREVYAVDRRAGAVALARDAGRGWAVRGILAPAAQTGLPAASAAAVLCLRLLGQEADGGAVLAEAARLLAPGGVVVVADWADVPVPAAPDGLVLTPLGAPPDGWALRGSRTPPRRSPAP